MEVPIEIGDLPIEILDWITGFVDPVTRYRFCVTCRAFVPMKKQHIPSWICDLDFVDMAYWDAFVRQMQMASWPKIPPFKIGAKRDRMTIQWRTKDYPIHLTNKEGTYSINHCTVRFTKLQKIAGHWHVCANPALFNGGGNCGCSSVHKKTTHASLNELMGKLIGVRNFNRRALQDIKK